MIMFSLKKQQNVIKQASIDTGEIKACDQTSYS